MELWKQHIIFSVQKILVHNQMDYRNRNLMLAQGLCSEPGNKVSMYLKSLEVQITRYQIFTRYIYQKW